MRRVVALGVLLVACGSLPDVGDGVVALELHPPASLTLTVPESITLQARALDVNGNAVAGAPVYWRTPDTTIVSLDSVSGVLVARLPGTARVQARVGSLASEILSFTIKPDTTVTTPTGIRQRP